MGKSLALGVLAVAIAFGALAAGGRLGAPARHQASGVILAAPEHGRVRIAHDAIAGYMPAMSMEFAIGDGAAAVSPGERVRFVLRVGSERSWIEDVIVTAHGAPAVAAGGAVRVARLHEGDPLPPFSLVDQNGAAMTQADLEGRLTVLTFIFTRCPVPDFCPLMSRRFTQLQSILAADRLLPPDVRLLSITIDPAFDTPPVLDAYARAVGADPRRWRFGGGDPAAVQQLARAFSVYVERNGALLDHTLTTALVDRGGRVVAIWRGNGWTVDEVVSAVRRAERPRAQ